MIPEALMEIFSTVMGTIWGGLLGLLPEPPSWVGTGLDAAADVWYVLSGFNHWIPVTFALTVAWAVMSAWLISMMIGVGKIIASYLTFGGGAT